MSSTNKTTYLQLHSWVRTDPVVCEDFNENFRLLDQAVGELQGYAGNVVMEAGSYVGTGGLSVTLHFEELPDVFFISGAGIGFPEAQAMTNIYSGKKLTLSASGSSVTWSHDEYANYALNTNGVTYQYVGLWMR